jgi:hypothetical protein
MNDLNELEHGVGAIEGILAKPSIQARLTSVLSPIDPNLGRFLLAAWQRIKGALAGVTLLAAKFRDREDLW